MKLTRSPDPVINEILDRSRRIESRLTSFINKSGFTVLNKKPVWDGHMLSVTVPSREVSLDEVLAAIPAGVLDDVMVIFAGKTYCIISL
jgi:hypothetical protein